MRLIHIADLHAGKTLGKVSRNPDLEHSLEQVVSAVKENKVSVVLVAGDVFDKANPDNDSKELIFDFFLKLKDLGSEVVVIAGNHDSYDFMKSIKGLSKLANVHIYDRPSKDDFLFCVGELKIACLPYPSERVLTSADEDSKKSYAELVGKFINFMAKAVEGAKYKILMAHLFVAGSQYTRTEKEATITHHYAVQPSSLNRTFDYVALGHVHKYQSIKDAPTKAFYTGSMFQLDFSEAGDKKFFNLIELGEEHPRIEKIELSLKNQLIQEELPQSSVLGELERLSSLKGYLKLRIKVEDKASLPLTIDRLRDTLKDKLIKIEQITHEQKEKSTDKDLKELNPIELYREYYEKTHGQKLPQNIEKIFLELLKEVE